MSKSKEIILKDKPKDTEKCLILPCRYNKLYSAIHNLVALAAKKSFKFGYILSFVFSLTACSLELNIEKSLQDLNVNPPSVRRAPDFVHGERVTTKSGHQITGVFGEISEKKKALNNNQWEFEEVFYE